MTDQTHADMFEWEPIHEEPPQKWAEGRQEGDIYTIGTTTTEWISADANALMEVKR